MCILRLDVLTHRDQWWAVEIVVMDLPGAVKYREIFV